MKLIRSISSTLKTWVFKKKLLKFSDRYRWETQACFYCPEMCRFSCPVAENLRHDGTTPRGKMSLVHLAERGYADEKIAGSAEERQWFLDQCTGCGRCTEYCVYENDVATHLRDERARYFEKTDQLARTDSMAPLLEGLKTLSGNVLICEPGRKDWWQARPALLAELEVSAVSDLPLPHKEWSWGKVTKPQLEAIGFALSACRQIWVESPEAGWLLAKGVKDEREAFGAEIRLVWQRLFGSFASAEPSTTVVFHESYHLARLFPRLDYSIPMYERGLMPFHHGWNMLDCGGEGHYALAEPELAREMARRFLFDLEKDGRKVSKIICQNLSCVSHLQVATGLPVSYWLDELDTGEVTSGDE